MNGNCLFIVMLVLFISGCSLTDFVAPKSGTVPTTSPIKYNPEAKSDLRKSRPVRLWRNQFISVDMDRILLSDLIDGIREMTGMNMIYGDFAKEMYISAKYKNIYWRKVIQDVFARYDLDHDNTSLNMPTVRFREYNGELENIPISEILGHIVAVSQCKLIINGKLTGDITIHSKGVHWYPLLKAILKSRDYKIFFYQNKLIPFTGRDKLIIADHKAAFTHSSIKPEPIVETSELYKTTKKWTLQAIIRTPQPITIIDNKVLQIGDKINGYVVKKILKNRVLLKNTKEMAISFN